MSFDWMQARRRNSKVRSLKRTAMYRRDLRTRAGIFYRLGYSRANAKARLVANLRWEFESGPAPESLSEEDVAAIVDDTYDRRPDHGARM